MTSNGAVAVAAARLPRLEERPHVRMTGGRSIKLQITETDACASTHVTTYPPATMCDHDFAFFTATPWSSCFCRNRGRSLLSPLKAVRFGGKDCAGIDVEVVAAVGSG